MLKRDFTEDHDAFRSAYRKFLQKEVVPHLERWREQGIVDREIYRKAGEQGFLMLWPDEAYGGLGLRDFRYEQIIIEESKYHLSGDWYSTLHSRLVGPYFERYGTEEQKQRFLPKCVSGEIILAIAMTEPDAGSDLAGMRTTARDMGDHYVLNGAKTYISNGINADVVVVAAKSDADNNGRQIGLFLVERGMPGFERGRKLKKMGLMAQDTAELFFNNVKVPKANVLGDAAKGFHYLMESLAEERLICACDAVVASQKAFDLTVEFVIQRKAFGKRVADFQNTQFKLAEMRTRLDMLQVYLDRCVAEHNEGRLSAVEAAKLKYYSTDLQGRVMDECLQLHGGAGFMDEYPISRLYTDARISRIFAGTNEIMKVIISREIFSEALVPYIDRQ